MGTYIVTRVRKERSADGTHTHIEGVCTSGGFHYTRQEVVTSIMRGDVWRTESGGYSAVIKPAKSCPKPNCNATPYIRTNPDSTAKDNLENLDVC